MTITTTDKTDTNAFLDEIVLSYCKKSPEKIAIKSNGIELSYQELGQKVEALSQQLLQEGIKPGDFVAVLLSPSENITISLLAIIRIGAIYAPLDPEHPDNQLLARFKSINPKCSITNERYRTRVCKWAPTTLTVEKLTLLKTEYQLPLPKREIDAPACIFFTSGTSGVAKGVLGSARAMRDSMIYPAKELFFTNADTLNSIARYAWSISMLELLAPLIVGGTSLILERHLALDLSWLKTQLEKCTAFHCPPALLRNLANYIEENHQEEQYPSQLRLVWYGGDTFLPEHIDTLHRAFPTALIGTAYGSTEIFGLSHIHFYQRNQKVDKVLIGKPVNGIEQLLWDKNNQAMSEGQEGELLIGGSRVAMKYWDNPSLSEEKFILKENTRYFRTGDYVSPAPCGALEFLLRKDNQVKIRGIRIELGEVEHQLCQHKNVREAVVLAVRPTSGDLELRAYIVGKHEGSINTQELQKSLSMQLPDYMVPTQWHVLNALPVTENFKVDRKKLSELRDEPTSSLSSEGRGLAKIWAQVIGKGPASADDNFFNIGGNSLLVMQLALEISKQLGTSVEVADIYRNPTLSSQLSLLNLSQMDSNESEDTIFATQGQVGLFFRELFENKGESITCTRYISSKAPYIDSIIREAAIVLIDRYPTLRTNLKVRRPNIQLLENRYREDQIEVIRKPKGLSIETNAKHPLKKHSHKFDLKNAPLVCAIISPMPNGSEILQLTAHHIASDDNAMGRVARDFIAIYDALLKKRPIALPNQALDYNDYAKEQFNKISLGSFNSQATFLSKKLKAMLPVCQNNPLFDLSSWDKKSTALHIEDNLSKEAQNSSFIDFVAALSWSLHKLYGRSKFVFCAHIALRRDSENTPIVGMFINLLPIITGIDQDHSFTEHVKRTATDFNNALTNSDVPYELILESDKSLKNLRKYPFDAFINELSFDDTYEKGYTNMIIPTRFATGGNEINMTVIQANDKKIIQFESPAVNKIDDELSKISKSMSDSLSTL